MKNSKFRIVNRWNTPAFIPKGNIFSGTVPGQSSLMTRLKNQPAELSSNALQTADLQAKNNALIQYMAGKKVENPFNMREAFSAKSLKDAGATAMTGLSGAVGGTLNNLISGGYSSEAGNTIGSVGRTIGTAVSTANPVLGTVINIASDLVGGAANALLGEKVDTARLGLAKESISKMKTLNTDVNTLDDIGDLEATGSIAGIYKGGPLNKSAKRHQGQLEKEFKDAKDYAFAGMENSADNVMQDQINKAEATSFAFGGPFDMMGSDMGAIGYGLMSDYLTMKKQEAAAKNRASGMVQTPVFMNGFAIGGDLQTHGSDWSTGLTHISAGGSHEESPYDGVQVGVDNEGIPNLVEEGEVIYNDYVFSNRIELDAEAKEALHFPKKSELTYAEAAKKLEKEIAERPNDAVSQAGFEKQMAELAEQQERQKQEMEAERAREAFEALSPEEQTAVMQNAAQQEQMAQQAAVEQEAMAQQPSPEETATVQQQQAMQADGTQAMVGQEPQVMAEGGHLYAEGSKIRRGVYKALGFHTDKEFLDWARKHKLRGDDKWEMNEGALKNLAEDDKAWQVLISDPTFAEAVKDNPALVHALANNYDFGAFTPDNTGNVTFKDISKGNWAAQDYEGWKESQDPAWLEAVEKGLVKEGMKQEDIAKALRQTDAYKRGSKWLQDSEDNRLRYLRTILEDENSPEVAKNYARKFIDANGWKKDAARDYESIFGANGKGVRETHPGTYWHTPVEATRGTQAQNWVINDDGSVEEIIGEVPTDWTAAGNYSWATPENDMTYNYYRRPSAAASASPETSIAKTPEEKTEEFKKNVKPKYQHTMFGLSDLGPVTALGMQAMRIGRPDVGSLYSAISGAGDFTRANWMPIDTRVKNTHDDPWFYTMPILAQANATDSAIDNSGINQGSKNAARLANSYNTTIALGNAARQQLDSNYDRDMKARQLRGTLEEANQREFGTTSRFNASAYNEASRAAAKARLNAAAQAMDANAGWYNSLYGNIGNIFKNFEAHRQENARHNMIADMAANGLFGVMSPDTHIAKNYLTWAGAYGGKTKRRKNKKGLTY